jgi:hypothetical protein
MYILEPREKQKPAHLEQQSVIPQFENNIRSVIFFTSNC